MFGCCKGATIRFTRTHAGEDKFHFGWGRGVVLRCVCSGEVRSAPWERPIGHRPGAVLARADEVSGAFAAVHMSLDGTLRQFAATQHFGRFRSEADID